ncbi:hypothetical protein ACIOYV_01660 [Pseudomonas sp. NPDC087342]|uniref:hypothetical protein n=1 Tax=Pseudomonas sp. NPDC087342 TaxID=3364437 RepID=UPI00380443A4
MLEGVEQHLSGLGYLVGMAAGLHDVLLLPALRPQDESALQAEALARGVGVYPLSPLFARHKSATDARTVGLILGYAGLTKQDIEEGIRTLAVVIQAFMDA